MSRFPSEIYTLTELNQAAALFDEGLRLIREEPLTKEKALQSEALFLQSLEKGNRSYELYYQLGQAVNAQGSRGQEARNYFMQAIETNPKNKNDALYYSLANTFFLEQKPMDVPQTLAQALTFIERAIAINPRHYEAIKMRGHILSNLKHYDEALKAYFEALKLNDWINDTTPFHPRLQMMRIFAIKAQEAKSMKAPKAPLVSEIKFYTEKVELLKEKKQYKEARDFIFSEMQTNQRYDLTFLNELLYVSEGACYECDLPYYQARDALQKAKECLKFPERASEALQFLEDAVQDYPEFAPAWYEKGLFQMALGNHERAKRNLQRAFDFDHKGELPDISLQLGKAYLELNDYENAAFYLEKAKNETHTGEAYFLYGKSLAAQENADESKLGQALQALGQALQLSPEEPYYYSEAAVIFQKLGQSELAMQHDEVAFILLQQRLINLSLSLPALPDVGDKEYIVPRQSLSLSWS